MVLCHVAGAAVDLGEAVVEAAVVAHQLQRQEHLVILAPCWPVKVAAAGALLARASVSDALQEMVAYADHLHDFLALKKQQMEHAWDLHNAAWVLTVVFSPHGIPAFYLHAVPVRHLHAFHCHGHGAMDSDHLDDHDHLEDRCFLGLTPAPQHRLGSDHIRVDCLCWRGQEVARIDHDQRPDGWPQAEGQAKAQVHQWENF